MKLPKKKLKICAKKIQLFSYYIHIQFEVQKQNLKINL